MEDVFETVADGKYYWALVFSYDNSTNKDTIEHKYEVTRQRTVRSKEFMESKFHVDSFYTFNSKASSSIKFEGIGEGSGSVEHSFHIETAYDLERKSETDETIDDTYKEERTYKIGPHSTLSLYQLCYEMDGVLVRADVFATEPAPDVIIKLKFSCHRRLLGFPEILELFSETFPRNSNIVEWKAIRDGIIKNSTKPCIDPVKTCSCYKE